jgi:hypothetical protein
MTIPGFTAEASLFKGVDPRPSRFRYELACVASGVQPALARTSCFSTCDQICEGDIIGACMPWCLCRCHGGTHCGLPS